MKIFRYMLAALLLMPVSALAQGGSMNGATGKPASINAVQVAGQDGAATLRALRVDVDGTQIVQPAPAASSWVYAAASGGIVNTAAAVTVKAAAGSAVRNYVMSMQCSHDTLGAATELAIRDGAGGSVLWRGRLQTAATDLSGATINFEPPLRGTANTLTEIVTLTAVTGGVYCNLQGYSGG